MKKLLVIILTLTLTRGAAECHICGPNGNSKLKYPTGIVGDKTCNQVVLDVWKTPMTPEQCKREQQRYKICCDGTVLKLKEPLKPQAPSVTYVGPHPVCNLCIYGDYPSDPSHVIHLLYVGADTCKNYYIAGLKGKISAQMCDPLRYFARGPCGCKAQTRSVMSSGIETALYITSLAGFILVTLGTAAWCCVLM